MGVILTLLLVFLFRKKVKFIYSALIFLIIFSNGLFADILWRLLEHPWKRLEYSLVAPSDGIVVLSGGRHLPPGNTKIIEWYDPDRFLAGIELYKADKSNRLIFTGGINPLSSDLPPEGDIYIKEAVSMGLPKEDLYTTYPVNNTLQEARAIKKLLNDEIPLIQKKIILVTSAFHMKRAKKIFESEGIIVQAYPVDFKSSRSFISSLRNPLKWMPNSFFLYRSSSAIREIIGRIIYRSW
ncbi:MULTISPECIES: YdcF family protein [Prochlorococcus]|uniref:DUF218 domain-containing protein n=1 Tax=Prochlorococcus marinus str. MIT 9314 TaxID=167548 RepID=A0A0A2AP67_PROMR|nr:YdcF family protein [Prochlorococcus marinus]KGG02335.1 hypothetical protein EU98_0513 [Prochlorococcus marinus str. MIT 9314]